MAEKSKVLLIEVLPKVAQKLRGMLERIEGIELLQNNITNSEIALETIRKIKPDIVLLEMDLPGLNGIQCTEIIKRENPSIQVVILSDVSSAETVRLAMRAGATDYINYNSLTNEELNSVIDRTTNIVKQEKMRLSLREQIHREPPTETQPTKRRNGKIISIYSPKGGSGVSTLVANLGYAYRAVKQNNRVLLVDLDLQYGDVALLFNQITNRSIMDLAVRIQNLDQELVETVIFEDEGSGIDLLSAPYRLDITNYIDGNVLSPIFEHLRLMYDLVIVNTGSYLLESTLTCLSLSDLIILTTIQQVTAIKSIRSFLNIYNEVGISKEKLVLVVNKFDEISTITPKKIGDMLGLKVSHVIPLDSKTAEKAANLGIPFTLDNRKAEISRAIFQLMELVLNQVTE